MKSLSGILSQLPQMRVLTLTNNWHLFYFFQCPDCFNTRAGELVACHKSSLWSSFLHCRDVFRQGWKHSLPQPLLREEILTEQVHLVWLSSTLRFWAQHLDFELLLLRVAIFLLQSCDQRKREGWGLPFSEHICSWGYYNVFCLMTINFCVFPIPNFSSLTRICMIA